eukprot:15525-Heterococcus_DN1.PRE.1
MSFEGFDFDGYMTAITLGFPAGNPVISQPTLWTPSKDNPDVPKNEHLVAGHRSELIKDPYWNECTSAALLQHVTVTIAATA